MSDSDDHYCPANARPLIDSSQDGEPILSATMSNQGAEIYMVCSVCGDELTFEYEFVDSYKA